MSNGKYHQRLINVGHCRPDQFVFARENLIDISFPLRLAQHGKFHIITHQRFDLFVAEHALCLALIDVRSVIHIVKACNGDKRNRIRIDYISRVHIDYLHFSAGHAVGSLDVLEHNRKLLVSRNRHRPHQIPEFIFTVHGLLQLYLDIQLGAGRSRADQILKRIRFLDGSQVLIFGLLRRSAADHVINGSSALHLRIRRDGLTDNRSCRHLLRGFLRHGSANQP